MTITIQRLQNSEGDVLYVDTETGEQWTEEEYRNQLVLDAAEADVTEQDEIDGNIPGYNPEQWRVQSAQSNVTYSTEVPTVVYPGARLAMKIARVMGEMEHVPKNGWNAHQKYHYATESDIADMARKAMARNNLALIPAGVLDYEVKEGQTRGGNPQYMTTVRMGYRLIDGDSGESAQLEIIGTGTDIGEKGIYKAYTGAKKYLLLQLFLISTGEDDPERETADHEPASGYASSPPRKTEPPARQQRRQEATQQREQRGQAGTEEPSTENQHKAIYTGASQAGLSNEQVKEEWIRPVYKVESAKDLTKIQARELIAFMRLLPMVTRLQEARSMPAVDEIAEVVKGWTLPPRPENWFKRKYAEARESVGDTPDAPSVDEDPLFTPEEEEELDRLMNRDEEETDNGA